MTTNAQHLASYIEMRNTFSKLFKSEILDVNNLSRDHIQELRQRIEIELSPENLACDGELRGNALRAKAARLNGALKALEAM